MRRFKKGDKVVCLNNHGKLQKGKIYEVLEEIMADNHDFLIQISVEQGRVQQFYEFRFAKYVNKKNHLPIWF